MSTAVTKAKATAPASSRRFMGPPAATAVTAPTTTPMPRATGSGTSGFRRKLLKPMAPNSLSRTATQKIGREKNRKAMNVTP